MDAIDRLIASGREKSAFELLHASGRLPSPKGVATRVIQLTRQDEVSIPELARVIGGDPAFVGRVIKAANGMIAHGRRPVISVSEALMVLGIPAIRGLATGFSLLSEHRNGGCHGFDYERYWSYSVALALGMQFVVAHTRAGASDEAFSLGLLVRVGELALATVYPDEYSRILADALDDEASLLAVEKDVFAIQHAELGAEMLEHWGVPQIFSQVARYYGVPELAGFEPGSRRALLLESIALARRFAEFCQANDSERIGRLEAMLAHAETLAIVREDMLVASRRMFTLWTEWISLLQLNARVSQSFPELAPLPDATHRASVSTGDGAADASSSDRGRERLAVATPQDRPLVLVIEPDKKSRRELLGLLADEDCSVAESGDLHGAMDLALELQPHMMVVGCADTGPTVTDLIATLRRMSTGRIMHMLLRVAQPDDDALVALLEAGGDDAVPHTLAPKLLLARLRAGLREVRLQRELERDRQELHGFAAQLAITNRRLRDMALTDPLTGFRNRRYAMDRIEQEWAVAERSERPLSCMVVDVDNLKEINDTFGHDAGDAALRRVAQALRKALRVQDVICRIGGDEFLVICPGAALTSVLACAERARRAVDEIVLDSAGERASLTVSIGVAERKPDIGDAGVLIKLADRGAYVAKHGGRNAVHSVQGH